jgi:hypothetical protein
MWYQNVNMVSSLRDAIASRNKQDEGLTHLGD